MVAVDRVRAIAQVGLEGDRYAAGIGYWSPNPGVDRSITLIEAEEIERLAGTDGIRLAPGATRRNVTTRGIRLNELVGRRFRIGSFIGPASGRGSSATERSASATRSSPSTRRAGSAGTGRDRSADPAPRSL